MTAKDGLGDKVQVIVTASRIARAVRETAMATRS
jgi:hypothetical protein